MMIRFNLHFRSRILPHVASFCCGTDAFQAGLKKVLRADHGSLSTFIDFQSVRLHIFLCWQGLRLQSLRKSDLPKLLGPIVLRIKLGACVDIPAWTLDSHFNQRMMPVFQ